jgi:hypothetical protein
MPGSAWIAMYGDNDLAGAALHLERALALDPADLRVLTTSATLLQSLGRLDEALALEEAAVRRDPVNVTALFNLGYHQRMAGRLDAAIASFRTVLSLSPSNGGAHCQLGVALLLKGDAKGALAEIEQETSEIYKMIGLPMAYHALGRKADSGRRARRADREVREGRALQHRLRLRLPAARPDKAFAWLDKAVEYGDGGLGEIVTDNLFDKIHADPRWLAFLRKIGKAPEQLGEDRVQGDAAAMSGFDCAHHKLTRITRDGLILNLRYPQPARARRFRSGNDRLPRLTSRLPMRTYFAGSRFFCASLPPQPSQLSQSRGGQVLTRPLE